MFALYLDEDAQERALAAALREAGFDCLTTNEASMRSRRDDEQLTFATSKGRVLYTKNTADFCRLDAAWRSTGRHHSGIVVLTDQRCPIGVQVRAMLGLAARVEPASMPGRLEFLLNHVR